MEQYTDAELDQMLQDGLLCEVCQERPLTQTARYHECMVCDSCAEGEPEPDIDALAEAGADADAAYEHLDDAEAVEEDLPRCPVCHAALWLDHGCPFCPRCAAAVSGRRVVPLTSESGTYREWDITVAGTPYCVIDEDGTWTLLRQDPATRDWQDTDEDVDIWLETHRLVLST